MRRVSAVGLVAVALAAGVAGAEPQSSASTDARCFELRTYTAAPGKLEALNARFRNHTVKLFEKHGMQVVGFWVPTDAEAGAGEKLIYVLAHKSRAAADASWKAFRADPEWVAVKAASETEGSLVTKVDSVFLASTDYSPLK